VIPFQHFHNKDCDNSPLGLFPMPATLSFLTLPRELRDGIYSLVLDHNVSFYPLTGTYLHFLACRLPPGLFLNHQILEEAAALYFAISRVLISSSDISKTESLFDQFPNDLAWHNVRQLQFACPEIGYAEERCDNKDDHLSKLTAVATQRCMPCRVKLLRKLEAKHDDKSLSLLRIDLHSTKSIHDFVIRCSNLQKLTISLKPYTLLDYPESLPSATADSNNARRGITPQEFELHTNFTRVLENKKLTLLALDLNASDFHLPKTGLDWEELFANFTQALEEEAEILGRKLKVVKRRERR
jgi:hypothetical protein